MYLFLFVFFALYSVMHYYIFRKACLAFEHLGWWKIALGGGLAIMVVMPLVVNQLERRLHFRLASALADVGYVWMAMAFWFCAMALLADTWDGVVYAVGFAAPRVRALMPAPRAVFCVIWAVIAIATCRALYEAQDIHLRRLVVQVNNLPAGADELTIAQISDLHLGVHTGEYRLRRILDVVRQAHPDILLSTGDLLDTRAANVDGLAELLAAVRPPLGKFAILGNHEYYAGLGDSLRFHRDAGFELLRQKSAVIADRFVLAGVDDPAGNYTNQECFTNEDAALPPAKTLPTIFMKHQPRVEPDVLGRYDVQLSGHTHGGQIFPFCLLTVLAYPHYSGEYPLPKGALLYVSRGAGTWGPPMRLFAPPEVTVITFRKR